jgi:hypothetical protein
MHLEEVERLLAAINAVLAERFHITHTTVQFERAGLPRGNNLYMPVPASTSERS